MLRSPSLLAELFLDETGLRSLIFVIVWEWLFLFGFFSEIFFFGESNFVEGVLFSLIGEVLLGGVVFGRGFEGGSFVLE